MVRRGQGVWFGQDPSWPVEALEASGKRHWSECSHGHGVFARIMAGVAADNAAHKRIMIDATYPKAHHTSSSLGVKQRGADARSGAPKVA